MRARIQALRNWAIMIVFGLFFGGIITYGILKEQLGEVLFNATLV